MKTLEIENVKNEVKGHRLIPFKAHDIECSRNGKQIMFAVRNNQETYIAPTPQVMIPTIGIRPNLAKVIFDKPEKNWDTLRSALDQIDKNKVYHFVANHDNTIVDIVKSKEKDTMQLDFDDRIDSIVDYVSDSKEFELQSVQFNPTNCSVALNVLNRGAEIECGGGDNWKFGNTVNISLNNQSYLMYYLRLICTNGMTTKEKLAYRAAEFTKDLARQFQNFAKSSNGGSVIKTRVNSLRNARASVFEARSVASVFGKQADIFMPEFTQAIEDFENAGYNIKDIPAKRARLMFTNMNLYDVFNTATYVATHERESVTPNMALELNKVAGEIFTKGPNLSYQPIDIYKGR